MGLFSNAKEESTFSTASGLDNLHYVVLQVTLKEKFIGTGSGNLTELENVINKQVKKGYRLHTITTTNVVAKVLVAVTESKLQWYLKKLFKRK